MIYISAVGRLRAAREAAWRRNDGVYSPGVFTDADDAARTESSNVAYPPMLGSTMKRVANHHD
jgi:hypothetical protein